jgi:hypothetical protein
MMADAVECVKDKNREPVSSAVDGYKAIAFIDSVKKCRPQGLDPPKKS